MTCTQDILWGMVVASVSLSIVATIEMIFFARTMHIFVRSILEGRYDVESMDYNDAAGGVYTLAPLLVRHRDLLIPYSYLYHCR